jgi:hypothetical protein
MLSEALRAGYERQRVLPLLCIRELPRHPIFDWHLATNNQPLQLNCHAAGVACW